VLSQVLTYQSYLADDRTSLDNLFFYPILCYANFIREGRDPLEKCLRSRLGLRASASACRYRPSCYPSISFKTTIYQRNPAP